MRWTQPERRAPDDRLLTTGRCAGGRATLMLPPYGAVGRLTQSVRRTIVYSKPTCRTGRGPVASGPCRP